MKIKTYLFTVLPTVLFLIVLSAAMFSAKDVYRVRDGRTIPFHTMLQDLKMTDFVFVGEIHDDPDTHLSELAIINALHAANVPLTIGLEMFRADSQRALNSWVNGTLPLDNFLPIYYDNWRQAWPLYRDIFTYAREHRIPMIGLNIPDAIAATVAQSGFASLAEKEKKNLPPGISCDVDPTYMAFIRRAYANHPTKMDKRFLNFCEAQMVWDKSMAWHLLEYRKKHPEHTIVVLAGVGHAWKRGIPEQIARESKYTFKVVMPLVPDQIEKDTVSMKDADYVILQ